MLLCVCVCVCVQLIELLVVVFACVAVLCVLPICVEKEGESDAGAGAGSSSSGAGAGLGDVQEVQTQQNMQDSTQQQAPVHSTDSNINSAILQLLMQTVEKEDGPGYHVSNTDAYSGGRALQKQQQQQQHSFVGHSGRLDGGEEQEYDNGEEDVRGLSAEDKKIKVRYTRARRHAHAHEHERTHTQ